MSFTVVLEANKENFNGTLQCIYSKPFRLRGDWEVAVQYCHMPDETKHLWLFSNIVDFSSINETSMQFLGYIDMSEPKCKPMYMKVVRKTFASINMEFRSDYRASEVINTKTSVVCVLHFRKS